ncbi:Uncharacterised protein [Vibrio cholerae]|nr:Uncharacterised protein [Vibrio cholerae]
MFILFRRRLETVATLTGLAHLNHLTLFISPSGQGSVSLRLLYNSQISAQ